MMRNPALNATASPELVTEPFTKKSSGIKKGVDHKEIGCKVIHVSITQL